MPENEKPAEKKEVESVHIFVTDDIGNDGIERIVAMTTAIGVRPLVTESEKELPQLITAAQQICDGTGKKVKHLKFSKRELVETFERKLVQGVSMGGKIGMGKIGGGKIPS